MDCIGQLNCCLCLAISFDDPGTRLVASFQYCWEWKNPDTFSFRRWWYPVWADPLIHEVILYLIVSDWNSSWFPSDFQVSRVDASRLSSSGSFFGRCFGLRPVWKVSSGLLNCSIFSVFNSLRPTFLFYAARSRAAALVCFSLCVCVCGCLSVWLIYSFQSARFSRCFFYWVSLYFTVFWFYQVVMIVMVLLDFY